MRHLLTTTNFYRRFLGKKHRRRLKKRLGHGPQSSQEPKDR
jgi:hypothetical protein